MLRAKAIPMKFPTRSTLQMKSAVTPFILRLRCQQVSQSQKHSTITPSNPASDPHSKEYLADEASSHPLYPSTVQQAYAHLKKGFILFAYILIRCL